MSTDKAIRTNVMRMLDSAKIPYESLEYEVDESDLSGVHVAQSLDFPPECMFKTLVAKGDKTGPVVFCLPVAESVDLKKAASVSGNKKVEFIHVKDLLALTGYIRGGVSPIGMKKKFPTWMDASCLQFDKITVSSGTRGAQLLVDRKAIVDYIGANISEIIVKKS